MILNFSGNPGGGECQHVDGIQYTGYADRTYIAVCLKCGAVIGCGGFGGPSRRGH